jgi:hypothetical protein
MYPLEIAGNGAGDAWDTPLSLRLLDTCPTAIDNPRQQLMAIGLPQV